MMVLAAASNYDSKFCPIAPSRYRYQSTLALSVKDGKLADPPLSAQVAARLIDTNARNEFLGWLYVDERGNEYVVLRPYVRRDIFVGFGNPWYDWFRGNYTQPIMRPFFRFPAGVEIRSCTEPD